MRAHVCICMSKTVCKRDFMSAYTKWERDYCCRSGEGEMAARFTQGLHLTDISN